MATLFTRIIEGEIPGRFVWKDDDAVAFLTIAPITPGHTLVVPRAEIDHWLDLPPALAAHLTVVGQTIGQALMTAFAPERVGLIIAGMEVPHCHLHVLGIDALSDLDFANADPSPDPAVLDATADTLRASLHTLGHTDSVPEA